jgi:hypothetical protein
MTTPTPSDEQLAQSNLQPPHDDAASMQEYIEQAVAGYYVAGNSGAAITLDYRNGKNQLVTLNASAPTITVAHVPPGMRELNILLVQDGSGSRLLPTFSPAANYGAAGAPTLSTVAGKRDLLQFMTYDSGASLLLKSAVKGF